MPVMKLCFGLIPRRGFGKFPLPSTQCGFISNYFHCGVSSICLVLILAGLLVGDILVLRIVRALVAIVYAVCDVFSSSLNSVDARVFFGNFFVKYFAFSSSVLVVHRIFLSNTICCGDVLI